MKLNWPQHEQLLVALAIIYLFSTLPSFQCNGIFLLNPGTFYWSKPKHSRKVPVNPLSIDQTPVDGEKWLHHKTPTGPLGSPPSLPSSISNEMAPWLDFTPRTINYVRTRGEAPDQDFSEESSNSWRKPFGAPLKIYRAKQSRRAKQGRRVSNRNRQRGGPLQSHRDDNKVYLSEGRQARVLATSQKERKDKLLMKEEIRLIERFKRTWDSVMKAKPKPTIGRNNFDPWHGKRRRRSTWEKDQRTTSKTRLARPRLGVKSDEAIESIKNPHKKINVASINPNEEGIDSDDQFIKEILENKKNVTHTLLDILFENNTKDNSSRLEIDKIKEDLLKLSINSPAHSFIISAVRNTSGPKVISDLPNRNVKEKQLRILKRQYTPQIKRQKTPALSFFVRTHFPFSFLYASTHNNNWNLKRRFVRVALEKRRSATTSFLENFLNPLHMVNPGSKGILTKEKAYRDGRNNRNVNQNDDLKTDSTVAGPMASYQIAKSTRLNEQESKSVQYEHVDKRNKTNRSPTGLVDMDTFPLLFETHRERHRCNTLLDSSCRKHSYLFLLSKGLFEATHQYNSTFTDRPRNKSSIEFIPINNSKNADISSVNVDNLVSDSKPGSSKEGAVVETINSLTLPGQYHLINDTTDCLSNCLFSMERSMRLSSQENHTVGRNASRTLKNTDLYVTAIGNQASSGRISKDALRNGESPTWPPRWSSPSTGGILGDKSPFCKWLCHLSLASTLPAAINKISRITKRAVENVNSDIYYKPMLESATTEVNTRLRDTQTQNPNLAIAPYNVGVKNAVIKRRNGKEGVKKTRIRNAKASSARYYQTRYKTYRTMNILEALLSLLSETGSFKSIPLTCVSKHIADFIKNIRERKAPTMNGINSISGMHLDDNVYNQKATREESKTRLKRDISISSFPKPIIYLRMAKSNALKEISPFQKVSIFNKGSTLIEKTIKKFKTTKAAISNSDGDNGSSSTSSVHSQPEAFRINKTSARRSHMRLFKFLQNYNILQGSNARENCNENELVYTSFNFILGLPLYLNGRRCKSPSAKRSPTTNTDDLVTQSESDYSFFDTSKTSKEVSNEIKISSKGPLPMPNSIPNIARDEHINSRRHGPVYTTKSKPQNKENFHKFDHGKAEYYHEWATHLSKIGISTRKEKDIDYRDPLPDYKNLNSFPDDEEVTFTYFLPSSNDKNLKPSPAAKSWLRSFNIIRPLGFSHFVD